MSKTIDQKVVEMRFDNKHFETNARQSMTTLEKLKAKLNFKGASKGLENLNSTANKVDMRGLSNAISTVNTRFSALEVMGVTALANITNSAVNAGKRMAKALTIDPVMTGFKEYETQINAVQTILANTQKEGTNIEMVNAALDELNEYADQTIYNFTEMTRNIGTFTAAGVKLDDSVAAIKGISNLAAMSGSSSQQASTAMYQLSQALANGRMNLQDWNSVVNAGMGGQVFQDALKRTAENMGTNVDAMIKKYGSFRESISRGGWITSEVLTKTLEQFTMAAEEGSEEWEKFKKSLMDEGYTAKQAEDILKLANAATDAATKVKTFTQLWEVIKESVQSGWAQTWRLIVGDFEDAKALFSPIAEFLTGKNGIITKMSNARNKLLKGALYFSPFTSLLEKLENSGVGKITKKIDGISKSLEYYQTMVNRVWRGDYKNQPVRSKLMEAEGHNYKVIQSLVNLGYKHKLTTEEVRKAEEKYGVTVTETTQKLEDLTDAQLKEIGLTDEEIRMYRDLEKQSKKTGKSIQELIKEMDEKNGRTLLLEGLANIGKSIVTIFSSIGKAWRNAFPPMTSVQLYNIIKGFNEFTQHLVMSKDTANDFTRTLKGVFAILDLITMVVGGGFKIAFTVLKAVLGAFNLDILEFTAILGDAIVKFRDWIEDHNLLAIAVTKSVKFIIKMGKAVADLAKRLWNLPAVQRFIEPIADALSKLDDITLKDVISALKRLGKAIGTVFSNINKHFNGVPGDILSGLFNGLKSGVKKVYDVIVEIASKIISKFEKVLGIKSPSRVFFAIGGFIIAGLIGGLLSSNADLGPVANSIVEKIKAFFTETDWGKIFSKIFTGGMSIGILMMAKSVFDSIKNVTGFFGGMGSMMAGFGDVAREFSQNMEEISKSVSYTIKSFGKVMRGIAFKKYAEGVKELAISLLIIAGAVALLTLVPVGELWNAVGVITVLAVILGALSFAMAKMSESFSSSVKFDKKNGLQISGFKSILFSLAAALLAMGIVVKILGGMSPSDIEQGFWGLAGIVVAMTVVLLAYGTLIKGKAAQNMDKAGKMLKKMASTLLLMVIVIKIISLLKQSEIDKGTVFIGGFLVFTGILLAISKLAGRHIEQIGKTIKRISWALLLMVGVVALIGKMSYDTMKKGAVFAAGFLVFVGVLVSVLKIGKEQQIAKIGGLLMAISGSMLIMAGVIAILGIMDWETFWKGAAGVGILAVLIVGLMWAVKKFGSEAPKLAGTLLALSGAIAILAGIALILSLVDFKSFMKGVACVAILGAIMVGLLALSKNTTYAYKTLTSMAIAIGVMAAAIAILSFIDPTKLVAPTIAMSALMGMFVLITKNSKKISNSWTTVLSLAAVLAVLGIALGLIALLPWKNTLGAAVGLSLLMLTLTGVLTVISKLGPVVNNAKQGVIGLLALCVPLLGLAGILYLMRNVDNAISSAVSLSVLLLSMSGVLAILTKIGPMANMAYPAMGALAVLIVGLGVLIGAIGALMHYCPKLEEFLKKGIPVLEKIGYALGSFFGNIIGGFLGGMSSGLPEIGRNLSDFMDELKPFIEGAKQIDKAAMDGVKALAETVLILTAANVLDGISKLLGADNSLADFGEEIAEFGESLGEFEKATKDVDAAHVEKAAKATKHLIGIAKEVPNSGGLVGMITGENDLGDFGDEISEFGDELEDFNESIKDLSEEDVNKVKLAAQAAQEMIKIAKEVPNSGGLVGMITGENDLGDFGYEMWEFGSELADFGEEIQNIDPGKVKESAKASKELIAMAKTFDSGLVDKISGEKDLGDFAKNLVDFGKKLVEYSKSVVGLNTDSINVSIEAASGLVELAKALPGQGDSMWNNIFGVKNLSDFAEQLKDFGPALVKYGKSVVGLNTKPINDSVDAARGVVNLAAILNHSTKFEIGEDGFTSFIKQLPLFGLVLRVYSKAVDGLNIDAISESAEAAKGVAGIATALNKSQGEYEAASGFTTFVGSLVPFGTNLRLYSLMVKGMDNEAIANSAEGAKYLTDVVHSLPESGGLKSIFAGGGKHLASFALQLIPFGYGLKVYSKTVSGLSIDSIKTSRDAVTEILDIYETLPEKKGVFDSLLKGKQSNFAAKLIPIAESLKEYANVASKIDTESIISSEEAFKSVGRMLAHIDDLNVDKITSFNEAVNALEGLNIDNFAKAFNDTGGKIKIAGSNIIINLVKGIRAKQADVTLAFNTIINRMIASISSIMLKSRFTNAGSTLMKYMIMGIKLSAIKVSSSMKNVLNAAHITIKSSYNSFYNAGKYVVDGFAKGIKSNSYKAKIASTAMAKESLTAARKALGIESPSKEFYAVGDFAGIGFVNALVDNADRTYSAGYDMADSARKGLSKAISKVADVINSDMDTQPTIRPVLDLTDIRNGANSLNSMFNSNPSIGVMSNLSAISSGMNSASQNGVNGDVVSAINNLRKDLGNVGGTTYNVNGVSYADTDTDINNAVRTLVRAAKVERRI